MKKTKSRKSVGGSVLNGMLLFVGLIATNFLYAPPTSPPQGSPPTNPPAGAAGQPCFGSACIPIDTGVVFLIIAGVLLGLRFVYVLRQKQLKA